ncbi:MAG: ribbon-helix-helix domain-containing protein [Candidatus Zixiibacteriota bacterium]
MMSITISLPEKLVSSIDEVLKKGEFKSFDQFIEKAVKDRLLALKRKRLAELPDDVERLIKETGITEEEILTDFEAFRDKLWRNSPSDRQ